MKQPARGPKCKRAWHSIHDKTPTTPAGDPFVTESCPNNGRIATQHLQIVLLAAFYTLIRSMGGDPEDATAYTLFFGALLNVRL